MKTTKRLVKLAFGALLVSSMSAAHAGLVNVTNIGTGLYEISFSPITLTMKGNSGRLDWLVFENFFDTDATANGSESGTQSIFLNIAGAGASLFNVNSSIGTYTGSQGGLDPRHLLINIAQDSASAAAGETIVVTQSGDGVRFTSSFIPSYSNSWSGNVAFWENGGGPMTTEYTFVSGSIPNPATLALFGIGLAGLGWSRRKKIS